MAALAGPSLMNIMKVSEDVRRPPPPSLPACSWTACPTHCLPGTSRPPRPALMSWQRGGRAGTGGWPRVEQFRGHS